MHVRIVLEDIHALRHHRFILQRLSERVGIRDPLLDLLVVVQRRHRAVPGEVPAGARLFAVGTDREQIQGEIEQHQRDVDAEGEVRLEIGYIEAFVRVRFREIPAQRERDRHADLGIRFELQDLHADAEAYLYAEARLKRYPVERPLAPRADDRTELACLDRLCIVCLDPDIDDFVVLFQQDLLFAAVAGDRSGRQSRTAEILFVKDLQQDFAVEIQGEAANRVLRLLRHIQLKDRLSSVFKRRKIIFRRHELRDLAAVRGFAVYGESHACLEIQTDLHIEVQERARRKTRLEGEIHAERRRNARVLEVETVVDRVVLERDGELYGKRYGTIGGLCLAVLRRPQRVDGKRAGHEVSERILVVRFARLDEVLQRVVSACFLEVLLCPFR